MPVPQNDYLGKALQYEARARQTKHAPERTALENIGEAYRNLAFLAETSAPISSRKEEEHQARAGKLVKMI